MQTYPAVYTENDNAMYKMYVTLYTLGTVAGKNHAFLIYPRGQWDLNKWFKTVRWSGSGILFILTTSTQNVFFKGNFP